MTKIINLYGGPGSGKSTMAADIFAGLKWKGYNVELAPEFAKDLVWEKRFHTLGDQIYIFGKQYHRIQRLDGQVDFVITDSPLLFSLYYNRESSEAFKNLVLDCYNRMDNIDIFLIREKNYNPSGRLQTLEQAQEIDKEIRMILDKHLKTYFVEQGNPQTRENIINKILNV